MERAQRVKQLFEQAQSIPSSHIDEWLASVDPDLVEELRGLLEHSNSAEHFFDDFSRDLFGLDESNDSDSYGLVGQTIENYQVLELLGRGGMGVVYRGLDTQLQREVALKLVSPSENINETARQRLLSEARLASKLEHPAIGTIYGIAQTDLGQDVIVMAYYPGKTLQQLIDTEQLDPLSIKGWVEQLLEGVRCAHENGVVHRDIKPSNLMVLEDGSLRILDFGAAMPHSADSEVTSTLIGTTSFMSPEQIRGETLTPATDYWSAGVVLMQLAQRLGWMDNVNAFVWAQNPAAAKRIEQGWVQLMLQRLLTVEPQQRLQLCQSGELSQSYPSAGHISMPKRWLALCVALVVTLVAAIGFVSQPLPLPNHKMIVLMLDDEPTTLERGLANELDDWLKAVDSGATNLSYLGLQRGDQHIHGENLTIQVSAKRRGDLNQVELVLANQEDRLARWSQDYGNNQRNQITRDLRAQLAGYLDTALIQRQLITSHSSFKDANAYGLYLDAKALVMDASDSLTYELENIDQAAAKLEASMQLESNPASMLLKATIYRIRYEVLDNPKLLDRSVQFINWALAEDSRLLGAYLELAHVYTIKQEFGSALAAYQMARELYPNHVDVFWGLARVSLMAGKLDKARRLLDEYELVAPYDWRVHNLKGALAASEEDYPQALSSFEAAITLLPEDPQLKANVAAVLVKLNKLDEAQDQLEQLAQIEDTHEAYFGLGVLAMDRGDYPVAIEAFTKALAKAPNDSWTLSSLAISLYYHDPASEVSYLPLFAQAIDQYSRAHESAPMVLANIEYLALLHAFVGDREKALKFLENALTQSVAQSPNYLMIIEMYELLGMRAEALEWLVLWSEQGADWQKLNQYPPLKALRSSEDFSQLQATTVQL